MMLNGKARRTSRLLLTVCAAGLVTPSLAYAQTGNETQYSIPGQDLGTSLTELARQSKREIYFSADLTRRRRAPPVSGRLTFEQALGRLLRGSGLTYRINSNGAVAVVSPVGNGSAAAETAASRGESNAVIAVTGSRIKGAPPSAPVIRITQEQMREAGQETLPQVVQSIPQNYSGGQNPQVLSSAAANNLANQNVTGASSINLRGLGSDATLTLLNGHRLAYNGANQAVDIAAIPVEAVDRIEIVADGASAIYGSDAVAGVANIILKQNYDGFSTRVRIGKATDGGDQEAQLSAVFGRRWDSGGIIASYNFLNTTQILANQRDYTDYLPSPFVLLPRLTSNSEVISAHQALAPSVDLTLDALYSKRLSSADGFISTRETSATRQRGEEYTIVPGLRISLPSGFTSSIYGTYGRDRTFNATSALSFSGSVLYHSEYCYCNTSSSAELSVEGPAFALPGGSARIAIGTGIRKNIFNNYYLTSGPATYGKQSAVYGFGELYLPFFGGDAAPPLLRQLSLTAAVRYDKYRGIDGVLTPKVGAVYSPVDGLELKGSWGKSFKAPTLQQQFSAANAYLFTTALLGIPGYPGGSTVLIRNGGNPDLKPEHATSWSVTARIEPPRIPHLLAELSYFHVTYRNRILQPVPIFRQAFSNPAFAEFLFPIPPASLQDQIIAQSSIGLQNFSGAAYDPSRVVAIIDDPYSNATYQKLSGVDASFGYSAKFQTVVVDLSENVSWLRGQQKTTTLSPLTSLAGVVYNPPHFRARTGATFRADPAVISIFYNYIGSVRDNISVPSVDGDSMSTIDLTAILKSPMKSGPLSNVDLTLSAQNLTNARPPFLRNRSSLAVDFDPSNYSAVGRFISLAVAKRW